MEDERRTVITGEPIIILQNVSKHFSGADTSITAVDRVDLRVARGDIFGIIGYSGAGKSTLIRLLNGLETATSGSIVVNGLDIASASERDLKRARLKIGMIFQHFNLLWSRTVAENIAFALEIAGAERKRIRARVAELIELVGLTGREDAYPSQLSGGQKQRVGIARALANEPALLLCDEATSALDPQTTDSILDLLLDINRKLGVTIVLITHQMHVVRRICSRVAVMEAGRIVEEGATIDVFTRPQQPITRRFVRQLAAGEGGGDFDPQALGISGGTVVKLIYQGAPAGQPVLAEAVERFELPFNILHGRLNHLRNEVFGELVVHLDADGEQLQALIAWLSERGIGAEILEAA